MRTCAACVCRKKCDLWTCPGRSRRPFSLLRVRALSLTCRPVAVICLSCWTTRWRAAACMWRRWSRNTPPALQCGIARRAAGELPYLAAARLLSWHACHARGPSHGVCADRLMYLARRDRPRQGEPCALATSTSTCSRRTHHHVMRECGGVSSSCSWMTCSGWCRRRVWRTASCLCWAASAPFSLAAQGQSDAVISDSHVTSALWKPWRLLAWRQGACRGPGPTSATSARRVCS